MAFKPRTALGSTLRRNWISAALFRLFGRGVAELTGKTRISTNFGVDDQLQAGIVVGLKARVLKIEPAAPGVAEHLPPGDAAADVVGSPPGLELGTALAEPRQQVDEASARRSG